MFIIISNKKLKKNKNKNNIIAFTKDIFAEHKLAITLSSVLLIISGLLDAIGLSLLAPTVSLLINDSGSSNYDSNIISNLKKVLDFFSIPYSLRYILGLIAIIMLLRSVFIFSQSMYISVIQYDYTSEIGKKYHDFLNSLSWHSFKKYRQATSINVFPEAVRAGASIRNYVNLISNFFTIIIYLIFLSIVSFEMTLISVVLSMLIILIFQRIMTTASILGKKHTIKAENLIQDISDSINLSKYLRTHGKTNFMKEKLYNSYNDLRKNNVKQGLNFSIFHASYEYAFIGFLMLGLLIAARYFDLPSSTIALITIILYRLFQRIKIFQQSYQQFNKSVPGYYSINEKIKRDENHTKEWGKKKFKDIKENIEFKNASVSIDGRKILSKINFKFEKNKINAVIGKSGSGKTTLVDIITGLTELDEGMLNIDGINITTFAKDSYQNSIGYVDQNPFLFNDTILNNIKWGSKNKITKNAIFEISKQLKIHDLINSLPNGYESNVGDFGNSLSGGERQRIVIARTLVNKPKILILDEATSQLDAKSQLIVMRLIKKIKKNTTIIMITHREETLEIADNVIEIN